MRTIAAGEFKAKSLAVMAEVHSTGQPVLVTKRGKPLVQISPIEPKKRQTAESIFGSLRGMVTLTDESEDFIEPIIPLEEWDHLKEDGSLFPPE